MSKLGFIPSAIALSLAAAPATAVAGDEDHTCPTATVRGEGLDVILLPGLGSSPDVWSGLVDAMEGEFRFHLFPVPGFAGEPAIFAEAADVPAALASRVHRYIDCQDLEKPAVVGHSMGGFTAMLVARDFPESVGRIVVVDALPFYSLIFDADATAESIAPRALAMSEMIVQMEADQFRAMQQRTAGMLTKTPEAVETIVEWSTLSDRRTFASAMGSLMTTDLRPDLADIDVPVTVLYATNAFAGAERVTPLYTDAYSTLSRKTLVEIPDSFHFTMYDQPDLTIRAVREALERK